MLTLNTRTVQACFSYSDTVKPLEIVGQVHKSIIDAICTAETVGLVAEMLRTLPRREGGIITLRDRDTGVLSDYMLSQVSSVQGEALWGKGNYFVIEKMSSDNKKYLGRSIGV